MQKLLKTGKFPAQIAAVIQRILGKKNSVLHSNTQNNQELKSSLINPERTQTGKTSLYMYYTRTGAPGELLVNCDSLMFIPKENPLYHLNTPSFQPFFVHNNIIFNVKTSKS